MPLDREAAPAPAASGTATRPPIVLRNAAGDQAAVSLFGGQLLSWQPAGQGEQLYCSPLAGHQPGQALRGGVPVCFPQFAERGPLAKHGLARTRPWSLATAPVPAAPVAEAGFQLELAASPEWPHSCRLELGVRMGPGWLELHLAATNTGPMPFPFTAALHTYLQVADVRTASLQGLQGCSYEDALDQGAVKVERAAALAFDGELDRVYRQAPSALLLQEQGRQPRRLVQQGFADTVVWNPGPAKAARLGDMPAADWVRMLCIEAAVVETPVRLEPGRTWRGMQRLELPAAAGFDLSRAAGSR